MLTALSPVWRRVARLAAAGLVCASVVALELPSSVLAECDPAPRSSETAVVRYAFRATVVDVSDRVDPPLPDEAPFDWHVELNVGAVYRGYVPTAIRANGWDRGCSFLRPAGLHVGDEIIVALDQLGVARDPSLFGPLLIWRRTDTGWAFDEAALHLGSDPSYWPPAARRATSIEQILSLVAASTPSTATVDAAPTSVIPWAALVLAFVVGLAAAARRMRPRAAGEGR